MQGNATTGAANNSWISREIWAPINHRAQLWKTNSLPQDISRQLGRQIKNSLQLDHKKQATDIADKIEGHLAAGDLQEAWHRLKGWYRAALDRVPQPCPQTMERQMAERQELYRRVPHRRDPIPTITNTM